MSNDIETFDDRAQRHDARQAQIRSRLLEHARDWSADDARRFSITIGRITANSIADGDVGSLELLQQVVGRAVPHPTDGDPYVRGLMNGLAAIITEAHRRELDDVVMTELLPADDSLAHAMLKCIERQPGISNSDIATDMPGDVRPDSLSRAGRLLYERGLATKQRVGTSNRWTITAKGIQALRLLDAGGRERSAPEFRLPATS